jgi:hypothetical protein
MYCVKSCILSGGLVTDMIMLYIILLLLLLVLICVSNKFIIFHNRRVPAPDITVNLNSPDCFESCVHWLYSFCLAFLSLPALAFLSFLAFCAVYEMPGPDYL